MGFTNVSRLAGGIVAYDRVLSNTAATNTETSSTQPLFRDVTNTTSLFKGVDHVFCGNMSTFVQSQYCEIAHILAPTQMSGCKLIHKK